ncbi:hypothetical protein G7Z17_g11596 [Cylindrodendrum hubeiense]|uniref:Uncharacterized protein n=1 Tax=Cylindrodendrum hubeiense TaxID=595255 RepID=A0A9P5LA32_9HYPO|nr:hypothetical protein G7Z17_g11596 [Cylindrodendrum hubeiense]
MSILARHPRNDNCLKVTLGQDAPVTQEGAGNAPSDSLAAESNREGGGFASNRGIHSENSPDFNDEASAARNSHNRSDRSDVPESYGGAAPTYINSQYRQDPNGPHGKNLQEGDWDESRGKEGIRKAMNAEPGSKNDPSRLAEHQFQLKQSVGGPDAGPRQGDLTGKTAYDTLDSEVPS